MNKKLFFPFIVFILLFSCTKWEVLYPTNSILIVDTNVGVRFTFYYKSVNYPGAQEVEILNQNSGFIHVVISRRIDWWGNETEILNTTIRGKTSYSKKAYFSKGDRLEVYIKVNNRNGDDVERWGYWQLGKTAVMDTVITINL